MGNWLGANEADLGSGVSHGGGEKEAGKLESFGDLAEVITDAAIEHLLENLRVSPVLCPSHRDLGCPESPVLPLRTQPTSHHPSGNACFLDLAVSFCLVMPLQCGFHNGFSPITAHSTSFSQ